MARCVQPNPVILEAQETALESVALVRYNKMRFGLKNFTFSAGYKSRSIDNAVLGPLSKTPAFHHD